MPTALRSAGIRLFASLVPLCALAVRPGAALAEDPATIEKITRLNRKAVDEYQNLNFGDARKLLREALDVAAEGGLDPLYSARSYIHMGVVVLIGFKQKDDALKLFRKAVQIQPDIKLTKVLATPEIQEVYDEAVAAQQAEAITPPVVPPSGGASTDKPVGTSAEASKIKVQAAIDPGLGAKKVVLSFSGSDDFAGDQVEMKEDPEGSGNFTTEIPASATDDDVVHYAIEITTERDGKVAFNGSTAKTLKIAMRGPDVQKPVLRKNRRRDLTLPDDREGPTWLVGLGVGSGGGWMVGTGEVNGADRFQSTRFALSTLAHAAPEVGYFLGRNTLLSVQLRLQLVTGVSTYYPGGMECGDGVCSPSWSALAGFGRMSFFFTEGGFRPYVSGILGLGQIRHVAKFENVTTCGIVKNQKCVDSVAAGPVFAGGGGGFLYEVTPGFALTLGTNALFGLTTFAFHIDVNAGAALTF